jgi:hypothetical protein
MKKWEQPKLELSLKKIAQEVSGEVLGDDSTVIKGVNALFAQSFSFGFNSFWTDHSEHVSPFCFLWVFERHRWPRGFFLTKWKWE